MEHPLVILVAHIRQNSLDESDLDDLVHELKSDEATIINNSGLEAQARYILEQLGPTEAMKKIDELI